GPPDTFWPEQLRLRYDSIHLAAMTRRVFSKHHALHRAGRAGSKRFGGIRLAIVKPPGTFEQGLPNVRFTPSRWYRYALVRTGTRQSMLSSLFEAIAHDLDIVLSVFGATQKRLSSSIAYLESNKL